jgi:TatD family-associated radical SAM protein
VYGSDNLWLEHEPSFDEVVAEFEKFPPDTYDEIVFCGYGEPTERLELMIDVAKYAKKEFNKHIRVNTNGLSNLINGKPTESLFENAVDTVSISLNAPEKDEYNKITRPIWDNAFDELLKFASNVKQYVPEVIFTIVDVLSKDDTEKCRKLAEKCGVKLRIRKLDT